MMISNANQLDKALENVKDGELIRLVYVSIISKESSSDPQLFEHIRVHAEDYNLKNSIKGVLCNDHRHFLQCLEGQKKVLVPLMARIFVDKRHKKVQVILLKHINKYSFHKWQMSSLSFDKTAWTADSMQAHTPELNQFLPFKPLTWSPWFVEHFICVMQKLEVNTVNDPQYQEVYNIIRDPKNDVVSIMDSGLLHWLLFGLVVITLGVLLKYGSIF